MIDLLIGILGAAVVVIACYAHHINDRARRSRHSLRHITGPRPWWGKR